MLEIIILINILFTEIKVKEVENPAIYWACAEWDYIKNIEQLQKHNCDKILIDNNK